MKVVFLGSNKEFVLSKLILNPMKRNYLDIYLMRTKNYKFFFLNSHVRMVMKSILSRISNQFEPQIIRPFKIWYILLALVQTIKCRMLFLLLFLNFHQIEIFIQSNTGCFRVFNKTIFESFFLYLIFIVL